MNALEKSYLKKVEFPRQGTFHLFFVFDKVLVFLSSLHNRFVMSGVDY